MFLVSVEGPVHSSVSADLAGVVPGIAPPANNAEVELPIPAPTNLAVANDACAAQLVPSQDSVNAVVEPVDPPKAKAADCVPAGPFELPIPLLPVFSELTAVQLDPSYEFVVAI